LGSRKASSKFPQNLVSILKKFLSGLGFLITFEIKGNLNSANYLDLLLSKVGTAF
jgi:hypothetical protein